MTNNYHMAVILDLNCNGSGKLLAQASQEKQFRSLHHWLLLSGEMPSSSEDPLATALEPLDLQLDSHVTIAHIGANTNQVLLQDVYRIGCQEPLIITPPREWSSGHHFPSGPQRNNYNGTNLKTSVLVMDGMWDTYLDVQYKHFDTEAKVHYMLMSYISEMLNFRGAFMFLKPSLSEVSVIYELPFSTSVWATYILTVGFLTAVLDIVHRIEKNVCPLAAPPDKPVSWSDALLNTVGIVCQQGSENVPKNLASRMVFIFMMLLSLFLLTSYSAIIVSLIQTTSSAISTLTDLMQSPMKLSMSDKLVNEITDPTVEKLFEEKLYTQPFHQAFITEEVGMERIRRGLNAFHGLSGAYKIISDTYEEHEKCRFKEIKMFEANHVGFPIRKGSPYIEHMRQSTQWMRESGMVGREEAQWYYPKPRCVSNGQNFVSVGIQDFYPALVILAYGILLSIIILVAEVLYRKDRNEIHLESHTRRVRNRRNFKMH